jgi:hypothetical protein
MKATHEHEFEAQLGLPEQLPKDERILWQGSPNWLSLSIEVYRLRSLGIYFMLMLLLQTSYISSQSEEWSYKPLILTGSMVVFTLSTIALWAWISAKTCMYTVTNKRIVMRIGVVYSLTFNFPLKKIISAHELHRSKSTSDISVTLGKADRIGWLHLWPHTRPWVVNQPEPTLRCIDDGANCARILKGAWIAANPDVEILIENKKKTVSAFTENNDNGRLSTV